MGRGRGVESRSMGAVAPRPTQSRLSSTSPDARFPWQMTRAEFEASFPTRGIQNEPDRVFTVEDVVAECRVFNGHSRPSHDVDEMLAALRYRELERELEQLSRDNPNIHALTDEAKQAARRITREQLDLVTRYPNLSKVDLSAREVDVRGIYTDVTMEESRRRFRGVEPDVRVFVTEQPRSVLDVRDDAGFKELLMAKKAALARQDIHYAEALRLELLARGYDAVRGGGYETETGELVFLNKVKLTTHRLEVERAIAEGLPVPSEVLSEYPDLASSVLTRK